jgi:hypothetical protein
MNGELTFITPSAGVGDAAELTASHEDYSAACQLHANS